MHISTFIWDPDRNLFVIPYLNHPVTWYGFIFAIGFVVGYFIVKNIFTSILATSIRSREKAHHLAVQLTDRLTFLVVLGTVIGARLGHVFFYGWSYYQRHPQDIFKVWQGGLASHGGAIGILFALLIFVLWHRKIYPNLTFLALLDVIVIPAAFVAGCIRIGNFINQEITGIPTLLPWGVIFLHSIDGVSGIPVHPVQLYESIFYFLVFGFLYLLWHRLPTSVGSGLLSGWFLTLAFTFRFFIEFLKVRQGEMIAVDSIFSMGQILSLPFIVLGLALLTYYYTTKFRTHPSKRKST